MYPDGIRKDKHQDHTTEYVKQIIDSQPLPNAENAKGAAITMMQGLSWDAALWI